jgi:ribosome biogenesis GTPase
LIHTKLGKVVKGLGGLYETRVTEDGEIKRIVCRAKGNLKRDEEKVLIGDDVEITLDDSAEGAVVISAVLPRRNSLIRPPLANLDYLFIVMATRKPTPVLETVDKLIAIAEHNGISPVIVITKSDLDGDVGEEFADIYRRVGLPVFVTSSESGEGTEQLHAYINENVRDGRTAAFAGASGVGKSTLMNSLFSGLSLATSEISRKIERGRHTTRHVEIFDISNDIDTGFLADTPGFSLIDFARFDFFSLEELAPAFRDIRAYTGRCRYSDCSHVGEGIDECAVARAVAEGIIPESRLDSYRSIYKVLKSKSEY